MKLFNRTLSLVLATTTMLTAMSVPIVVQATDNTSQLSKSPKLTTLKNGTSGVVLKWNKVNGADGYYVYRKTANTSYKKIATVTNALKYTDSKAKSNKKYTYSLKAYNSGYTSQSSNSKSVLRVGTPKITVKNKAAAIKITWKKVTGATKYIVSMKKHGAKSYKMAYSGKKKSYTEDNIGSGEKYDIKVKAVINKTKGAFCNPSTKVFLEKPALHAEEYLDLKGITLEWNKVKNAEGYRIYRSLKSKNSYKKIKTIKNGNTTSYIDTTCVSINSYKYYIVAYNGSDKSVKSNVDSDVYGYIETEDDILYLTISKGEVYKDIYTKINQYGAVSLITWSSSDSSIVKVSDKGVITGVKKGSATLTAKATYNGKVVKIKIVVTVE